MPRQRVLFSRPGREEGESRHLLRLCWQLRRWERFGGGVGIKDSIGSGDWLLKVEAVELPARYLQDKSNRMF